MTVCVHRRSVGKTLRMTGKKRAFTENGSSLCVVIEGVDDIRRGVSKIERFAIRAPRNCVRYTYLALPLGDAAVWIDPIKNAPGELHVKILSCRTDIIP